MPQPWEATLPLEVWQASLVVALVIDVVVVLVADAALKSALGDYTKWRVLSRGVESVRKARRRAKVVRGASLFALSALTVAASLFLDGTAVDRVEYRRVVVRSLKYNRSKSGIETDTVEVENRALIDSNLVWINVSETVVENGRKHRGRLLVALKQCDFRAESCPEISHKIEVSDLKNVVADRHALQLGYSFRTSAVRGILACIWLRTARCNGLLDQGDGVFHAIVGTNVFINAAGEAVPFSRKWPKLGKNGLISLNASRTLSIEDGLWLEDVKSHNYSLELGVGLQSGVTSQLFLESIFQRLQDDTFEQIRPVSVKAVRAKVGLLLVILDGIVILIALFYVIIAGVMFMHSRKLKVDVQSICNAVFDGSLKCSSHPGERCEFYFKLIHCGEDLCVGIVHDKERNYAANRSYSCLSSISFFHSVMTVFLAQVGDK